MKKFLLITSVLAIFFISGCAKRNVTRVDPSTQIDLSGRWNDTDARMAAEALVKDVLAKPWINEHRKATGKKPVVIVGYVKNKTHEHIDEEVIILELEKVFINTGMVRVVQSKEFREAIRKERGDQQEFADPETRKKWLKELGADYMLFGTITSIVDQYGKEKVVSYKVNLELSNLETNEKVWMGDKEIKKYIKN